VTWCTCNRGRVITYISTREGWLYLAAVLDVYSRAIVGWAMSQSLGGQLTTDALAMAISRRGVPDLVHSDRGSTYATSIYLDLIRKHGIRQSMSRKGNCWDTQSKIERNARPSLTRAGIGPLPLH
jgi:putative transposase